MKLLQENDLFRKIITPVSVVNISTFGWFFYLNSELAANEKLGSAIS